MKDSALLIGYWFSPYEMQYPHPSEFIEKDYKDDQLVSYLNNAYSVNYFRGFSSCRICRISNGTHEKTDGVFIWPVGLAHYVEAHNVKLPDEFINHVKSNNYIVPDVEFSKDPQRTIIEHDKSVWDKYCNFNRKLSVMDNYIFGYQGKDPNWIREFLAFKGFNVTTQYIIDTQNGGVWNRYKNKK